MRKKLLSATVGLALLAYAGSASAALVTATYTGTVGTDTLGNFDSSFGWTYSTGTQYTGDSISVAVTYNTALGPTLAIPGLTELYGGAGYGTPSPASAVVTIGNHTFTVAGQYTGVAVQSTTTYGGYDEIYHDTSDNITTIDPNTGVETWIANRAEAYIYNGYGSNPFVTTDLTASLNYNVQSGDYSYGQLYLSGGLYDPNTGYDTQYSEQIEFTPTNVTVSGVPESATWAMMLIGFAGVGMAGMRIRRKATISA